MSMGRRCRRSSWPMESAVAAAQQTPHYAYGGAEEDSRSYRTQGVFTEHGLNMVQLKKIIEGQDFKLELLDKLITVKVITGIPDDHKVLK